MEKLSYMSISLHEKSHKNRLAGNMLYLYVEGIPKPLSRLEHTGASGEPEKKVLTAVELPKLGDGEVKGIDVVVDGE